jgi:amidohydrolase
MEISAKISQLHDELIELRRDFHRHPELGYEEYRTASKVASYLEQCGLEVRRIAKTGVVGLLRGTDPRPTLMLRADMDALPVQEEADVPYRSLVPGKMHGCGHDGHTAMLLIAAKVLSQLRNRPPGNIKFVFEPNEENVGALAMIEEGVLEDPPVEACLGLHLWISMDTGKISITSGPVMAGMDHFEVIVKGQGGHTASPQLSVDPIIASANLIQSVQIIQTREIDVFKPTVIMFGRIQGGTASNVVADRVTLSGTIRYLYNGDERSEENPKERFRRIVTEICRAYRTEVEVSFPFGHPALINDPSLAAIVEETAVQVLGGQENVLPHASMAGEDFSEFASRRPSAFYFVGCGNPGKGTRFPLHHPRFNIDEDALTIGVEMHVRTALRYLAADQPEEGGSRLPAR